jgi:hypothetical protein
VSDRPDESAPNRLYVEGADAFHVVCALARKAGIRWTKADTRVPFAPSTNGNADAQRQALIAVKALHPCVGLVLDGDDAPRSRWESVRKEFGALGIVLPDTCPAGGAMVGTEGRRVGIWLMPGEGRPGAVEGLVESLVPFPLAGLWPHAVEATKAARTLGAAFADKDLAKSQLRAWLAWQAAPGAPYGRAIERGFLNAESPTARALVTWFRQLFGL